MDFNVILGMCLATLEENHSIDSFFNVEETATLALFEHLSLEFLDEFNLSTSVEMEFHHCYYHNAYQIRPVGRKIQNSFILLSCSFEQPPSRNAVDRFFTALEHVVDKIFDHLVEQAAAGGLIALIYSIDSADVKAMHSDKDGVELL